MIRRLLLPLLTFAFLALAASGRAAAPRRPNFVFMITDDQRADAMSLAGNRLLRTPNMDRIGREGIVFRNAFVTNALCSPSRASFLTGLYSHTHGVIDNKNRQIPAEIPIVSDHLRAAGYRVAFCGKSHQRGALRDRQWDYYFAYQGQGNYLKPRAAEMRDGRIGPDEPYEGWMDDVVTDHAVRWLERQGDEPFCLFLFFKAPHRSWTPAPRHRELFVNDTIAKPATFDEAVKGHPGKPRAFAEADNKVGNAPDVTSLDFVKDYYRALVGVDENVGKVLKALEERRLLDATAVIYSSDNGFFLGEWGLYDKRLMHEPSIRVPMLIRYPPLVRAGRSNTEMVLNIDVAPTMLDLAGLDAPARMHGRSMLPLLKGERTGWRKDWLYEYYEFPGAHSVKKNRGVRTRDWKLIHYFEEPQEWELYDLKHDPGELHNLYGDPRYQKRVDTLVRRMHELRTETGDRDP